MSWSTDLAKAEWFRDRWIRLGVPAHVWRAVAHPAAILGVVDDRQEHEVIVNPMLLDDLEAIDT